MAWLDDRVWAHPKFASLSPLAFRAYVYGVCYACGFGTSGRLTPAILRANLRVLDRHRDELLAAGLWDRDGDDVLIHDWKEHNGKRDERRRKDRERKRTERLSCGQDADSPPNVRRGQNVDVPVLKEVKEVKEVTGDGSKGRDVTGGSTGQPPDFTIPTLQSVDERIADAN